MKLNPELGFEHDEVWITNPYASPCGRCPAEDAYGKTHEELLAIFKSEAYLAWLKTSGECGEEEVLADAVAQAKAEREEGETGACCLCDGRYERWGNNPYPLCAETDMESRCCDECNSQKVIRARMISMFRKDALRKRLAEAKAMRKLTGRR